ncbi:S-adenosyl-L-methionine-dependent methyltransferase [Lipomyces oligophaga]|uniref:S-adenosyl-L-methionine-dependent methyltransferase n=1 Tax=Lipomyces oligophaga TaxID=45792 RepID=UPI0034CD5257
MGRYLILLAQKYENFRKAELEALATLEKVDVDFSGHNCSSPFLFVTINDIESAQRLLRRSILARAIYEVWGAAGSLAALHEEVKSESCHMFPMYKDISFKFDIISFKSSRTKEAQRDLIDSFSYLGFEGPIKMRNPDEVFAIIEEYSESENEEETRQPRIIVFGRLIAESQRSVVDKYDLKKRRFIGTTSFDAELALISCNIALAGPSKIVYDPFAGTGSFLVAASHFGAMALGSDIDGRQMKGKAKGNNIRSNYKQYHLQSRFLDTFIGDFTHNPIRPSMFLDAIVCDPPYGVREGLKVLGSRDPDRYADHQPTLLHNGQFSHLQLDYIPPKKPYRFDALLDDLMDFSALHLADEGRLCCWMPTSNEDYEDRDIPYHADMILISNCVQEFNKWSRRLLTYVRLPRSAVRDGSVNIGDSRPMRVYDGEQFREKYFRGFNRSRKQLE